MITSVRNISKSNEQDEPSWTEHIQRLLSTFWLNLLFYSSKYILETSIFKTFCERQRIVNCTFPYSPSNLVLFTSSQNKWININQFSASLFRMRHMNIYSKKNQHFKGDQKYHGYLYVKKTMIGWRLGDGCSFVYFLDTCLQFGCKIAFICIKNGATLSFNLPWKFIIQRVSIQNTARNLSNDPINKIKHLWVLIGFEW